MTKIMKTKLFYFSIFIFLQCIFGKICIAQVGISPTATTPDASAGLDVNFTNKGLLMPRVALSATNVATIASPATGLLVYNTASTGTAPNQVCPGTYQWNGSRWVRFNDGITCGYTALSVNCSGGGSTLCPPAGTVTDYDGNVYPTVIIGTQTWMAENLKVTHYRNGIVIPNVTNNAAWAALSTGALCASPVADSTTYGKLYNGYAVIDSRNLCPTGWHIPSNDEWTTFQTTLGGQSVAGVKIKECGNTHWYQNPGATNESCFTALPAGYRYWNNGNFLLPTYYEYWWSSTTYDADNTWYWDVGYYVASFGENKWYGPNKIGYSLRCLKN